VTGHDFGSVTATQVCVMVTYMMEETGVQ